MKLNLLVALTSSLAVLTSAVSLDSLEDQIPSCASDCVDKGLSSFSSDDEEAWSTLCSNPDQAQSFGSDVATCIVKAGCETSDVQKLATVIRKICVAEASGTISGGDSGDDSSGGGDDDAGMTTSANAFVAVAIGGLAAMFLLA